MYHYAGNNPVRYVDPTGEFVISLTGVFLIASVGVLFTKKKVNDFISVGYITLDIDKKGILKSYRINNQLAIDMLYCELRNLQLKLNIGSTNE